MSTGRPPRRRHAIGCSLISVVHACGLRMLSLRETAWFYAVGLLTAAVLIWSPSRAASPQPVASSVDTPQRRELSSATLRESPQIVHGLSRPSATSGAEPLVVISRRTIPHLRVGDSRRGGPRRVGRATILDIRTSPGRAPGTGPQPRDVEGITTRVLWVDDSASPATSPGDSSI